LALLGGLVGGIVVAALPVPIVGTVIGACLEAFAGSLIWDLWAGHPLFRSFEAGWGGSLAGLGRTVSKLALSAIIVIILALEAFF
jgi:hypothetical protein